MFNIKLRRELKQINYAIAYYNKRSDFQHNVLFRQINSLEDKDIQKRWRKALERQVLIDEESWKPLIQRKEEIIKQLNSKKVRA